MVSTKQQIKDLVAQDKDFTAKLNALKVTVDEFIDASNEEKKTTSNELYEEFRKKFPDVYGIDTTTPPPPDHTCPAGQHWDDAQGKCVDDTVTPPPPPPPEGDLLYDSNRDIDWNAIPGESLLVSDTYGNTGANGKGFHMNASGHPRMILMKATKELILEHDGKYGRGYFCVCNYASRIEAEVKLTNANHNASFKSRNRHQFRDMVNANAPDSQTQGGQGSAFHVDSCDADLEVVHGTEIGGPSANYPKLEINKYFKIKFSQFDKNGKIHVIDEIDRDDGNGFKVVNEGDVNAPSQFFNKAEFESWSEFWVRLNANTGGRLYIKNLRMFRL